MTIERLEKPRVMAGDFAMMRELIGEVEFGDYFVNFEDDALYQFKGDGWQNIATGVKTTGGGAQELAPFVDTGFDPSHGYGGGSPTGGGTGAAGGSSVSPGQSPGDPPVSGSGSAMPGGGSLAFSGGRMENTAGSAGTDFPAAGTIIKLDIWNGVGIAGVDCTLDTAQNRIIIGKTGKWRVHARWFVQGSGADTDWGWNAYIYVNGVQTTRHTDFSSGTAAHATGQQMDVDDVLDLTSGDILDVRANVTNEASPVTPGQTAKDDIFEVIYLGS